MALLIHPESHLDHGLSVAQLSWVLDRFKDRTGRFLETVVLPVELGCVRSSLRGPAAGDAPIGEGDVVYKKRGARNWLSRFTTRHGALGTRLLTVIAGEHDGLPCVLFTAFGGPAAPREPGDPTLVAPAEIEESKEFWSTHALAGD